MEALRQLKAKIKEEYKSSFDFTKYEIDEVTKNEIIENEIIIFRNFRNMSESLFLVCKALYENSLKLKAEGSFMEWYQNIGLSKDKVSELLKRYELYINFPDKKDYVTALSTQAVKILTAKALDMNIVYDIADLQLRKVEDIKEFIEDKTEKVETVTALTKKQEITKKCVNYKRFESLKKNISKMSSKELSQTEKEIASLEKYLKEIKATLAEKAKMLENENNLKLEIVEG